MMNQKDHQQRSRGTKECNAKPADRTMLNRSTPVRATSLRSYMKCEKAVKTSLLRQIRVGVNTEVNSPKSKRARVWRTLPLPLEVAAATQHGEGSRVAPWFKTVNKHFLEIRLAFEAAEGSLTLDLRPANLRRWKKFNRWLTALIWSGSPVLKQTAHEWRTLACAWRDVPTEVRRRHREPYPEAAKRPQRHFATSADALMFASRVPRSVDWKLNDRARNLQRQNRRGAEAVGQAVERWTNIRPHDKATLRRVMQFLNKELPVIETTWQSFPDPGMKACIEAPPANGGVARGAVLWGRAFFERDVLDHQDGDLAAIARSQEGADAEAFIRTGEYTDAGWARYADERLARWSDEAQEKVYNRQMADEAYIQAQVQHVLPLPKVTEGFADIMAPVDGSVRPPLEPIPLPEMGDKIRLASTHSAPEVWLSRKVNHDWLKFLKRSVHNTKWTLRGKPVMLSRKARSQERGHTLLYSADLSAATDYIPHKVAQAVALVLCQKARYSADRTRDIMALLGEHTILDPRNDVTSKETFLKIVQRLQACDDAAFDEAFLERLEEGAYQRTTNGIHMGLGPSWVILSLLNHAAAALACPGNDKSYSVCGDDLIALWTSQEIARYEANLTELGLVVNTAKCFRGPRGVFCEQLVEMESPYFARSRTVEGPAELGVSKVIAGRSRDKYAATEALTRLETVPCKAAKRLAHLRHKRVRPTNRPGSVAVGGCGVGIPNLGQLTNYLKSGAIRLKTHTDEPGWGQALTESIVSQHMRVKGHEYVKYEDIRNALLRETEWNYAATGDPKFRLRPGKPISARRFRTAGATRSKPVTVESFILAWTQSKRVTCAQKQLLRGRLRRAIRQNSLTRSDRARIWSAIESGGPQGWVPLDTAHELFNQIAHPTRPRFTQS
uniref:RNA-dependent RNA polymerase n=1 Tax=Phytophthora palustris narna-like virus 3-1 TaxID=2976293 RepID=A0A9E8YWX6_9VIRU|nr:RNA-dependent RNA polymerase [Phytophthora palustris narna-like virus 3-1]